MKHVLGYLLAALAAGSAWAQDEKRPDPADPEVKVPPPVYRSAFDGYQPTGPDKRISWREANDEAARVGGHIGVLRDGAAREKQGREEAK